jgi:chorismate mutase/prephenate dehydratase
MDLAEVRKDIDRVDKEIKKLFKERMVLADNVARIKAETEDDIYKPDREEIIISNLTGDVDDNIKMEYTALIKRIMEISRKYQYGRTLELRNCLDIDYTESEPEIKAVAMIKPELYICQGCSRDQVVAVDSYEEVYKLIENGQVDAGMGILEDISYGVSDALHELLTGNSLYIYRCNVVKDCGHNRKVVTFAKKLVVEENHNRIKVMFKCKNRSGSLSSVLSMISDYGVNLTEIHSAPDRKAQWNYRFYVELGANLLQDDIRALIFQLMNETEEFTILGSYYCQQA